VAKPPRDRAPAHKGTYFVTTSAFESQALFQSQRAANLLIETILGYREQCKFLLHEFVVMPNHLHFLISPAPNVTLERAMQLIKGGYSHRAGKELGIRSEIWQRGFVDHRVRDAQGCIRHQEYIRLNAVRAHMVDAPENYPFSSAFSGLKLDPCPQG
jgi:REP-associated tyrosine transposase